MTQILDLIPLTPYEIIGLAIAVQVLQLAVSILRRKEHRDTSGDPWDGRTLEWSIPSPAPIYNFAVIPNGAGRDPFWATKQHIGHTHQPTVFEDIELPKNTAMGIYIAVAAFFVGFGLIWHIWWLAAIGLLTAITLFIVRSSDDEPDYILSAKDVAKIAAQYHKKRSAI